MHKSIALGLILTSSAFPATYCSSEAPAKCYPEEFHILDQNKY